MRKVPEKILGFAFVGVLAILLALSCANPVQNATLASAAGARGLTAADPTTFDMKTLPKYKGNGTMQTPPVKVGTVAVWLDDVNQLHIRYTAAGMSKAAVWVGLDWRDLPVKGQNNKLVPDSNEKITLGTPEPNSSTFEKVVSLDKSWFGKTVYIFAGAFIPTKGWCWSGDVNFFDGPNFDYQIDGVYFSQLLPPPKVSISGSVYLDINGNSRCDLDEPLIPGISVGIVPDDSQEVLPMEPTTASNGNFTFDQLTEGHTYTISVGAASAGFIPVIVPNVVAPQENLLIGLSLDFGWIGNQTANTLGLGTWKTNIDKDIAKTQKGRQVSDEELAAYLGQIPDFALQTPLGYVSTLKLASALLGATSSVPTDILTKHLLAAEFSYLHLDWMGGPYGRLPTYYMICQGEYILAHPEEFTGAQITDIHKWLEAFNESKGVRTINPYDLF